jgi:hypothetical protein
MNVSRTSPRGIFPAWSFGAAHVSRASTKAPPLNRWLEGANDSSRLNLFDLDGDAHLGHIGMQFLVVTVKE